MSSSNVRASQAGAKIPSEAGRAVYAGEVLKRSFTVHGPTSFFDYCSGTREY